MARSSNRPSFLPAASVAIVMVAGCHSPGSRLYRCARDFDHLLGYQLTTDDHGYWMNYGRGYGPQDWHFADGEEVLSSYDRAEYVRTWWAGACDVEFPDAVEGEYRLWVWAKDEAGRDMAVYVYVDPNGVPAIAGSGDYEGWYDCGVVAMRPGGRVWIRKVTVNHPRDWSLVKAVYLTRDLRRGAPAFSAEGQGVPEALSGSGYLAERPVGHDWVLDWERTGAVHPRVLVSADEIGRFRSAMGRGALQPIAEAIVGAARAHRWDSANSLWADGNWTHCPHAVVCAAGYLISGERELAEKAKLEMIAHMRQQALAFHREPPGGEHWDRGNNTLGKFFRRCLLVYDTIASSGVMTAIEDREARALLSSLAYYMARHEDGHWEGRLESGRGYWWWNGNTDRFTALGICGLVFPRHPASEDWVDNARVGLHVQMTHHVREDGSWPESSSYGLVAMQAFNAFFHACATAGVGAPLDDPKLRRFYDWYVETSSPRVVNWWRGSLRAASAGSGFGEMLASNWRHVDATQRVAQGTGESGWNNGYASALGTAASLWGRKDPGLAGRLKWAWQEWGGEVAGAGELLIDLVGAARSLDEVKPTAPRLASRRLDGYVVCRDRFGEGDQELELFVDAQLKRSHGYPDFGAYHLYAYGTPITKDWDLGGDPNCYRTRYWNVPWARSVSRYPWHYATDEACRKLPPTMTDADVFLSGGADGVRVDYEPAGVPGLCRNYVLVKSGPPGRRGIPYLAVFDDCGESEELLQCCYAVASEVTRRDRTLAFRGYWGVDYEVHYLVPGLSQGDDWLNDRFGRGLLAAFAGRGDLLMKGRNMLAKTPAGGDWVWIGYPRRRGTGNLTARRRQIGGSMQRVEVTVGNTLDVVLLSTRRGSHAEGRLDFDGVYGVVRNESRGRWTSLTCLGGGHLSDGAHRVAYEGGSISLVFDEITAIGDFSGGGGSVRFSCPRWAREGWVLEIDGAPASYTLSEGVVRFEGSRGRHTLQFVPHDYPRPR
ncbi:MAG: hypothetical protein JXQ73_11305 [Phycisphaerae bacterium]|nr:hypothetical protein [Phycisphaerae bacterium]